MSLSRRDLLKGGLAAAAAAGAVATAPRAWAEEASDDEQWDAEYDVVVLGMGGTGMNAAIAAYESGASVLISEVTPEGAETANTKSSGQCVMATDDADALYTYLSSIMGQFTNWDEDVLHAYCEGCLENWDWMVSLGMDPDKACMQNEDDLTWKSNELVEHRLYENAWGLGRPGYIYNWHEFPEYPENEHCLIILTTGKKADAGYYNLLHDALYARADAGDGRMTVWCGAPGRRLVRGADGSVVGAVIEKDGAELRVKANGGVVLATGGFEANTEMMQSYAMQPYVYLPAGFNNMGDGIKMAEAVGAQLWHMGNVAGWNWGCMTPWRSSSNVVGTPDGVFVGRNGARFTNEAAQARHGRINIGGRWIMRPVPLPTYAVVDADHISKQLSSSFSDGNEREIEAGVVISADTLEELAQKIREAGDAPEFDENGEFEKALERYNAHCHANDGQGEEDDFGRMCTVPVENGPFYALKIGPTLFNTQGGPRRNKFAQVVDNDGMPIEGLFVGGELGSVFPDMYNGGGNLGETMVFGRMAGRNAAARAQGTFAGATEPVTTYGERVAAEAAAAEQAAQGEALDIASVADGTYEGTGAGFGGDIVLSITVEGGAITACEVVSAQETDGIGAAALPVYCQELVDGQALDAIDVASGASNTLRGFKAAVEDALGE